MKRSPFKMFRSLYFCVFIMALICCFSCKKQDDWLNIKNNKSDVTPQTLQDFQAILDNDVVFNDLNSILGVIGTDNIYFPDTKLDAENQVTRNTYLWASDIYQGALSADWVNNYQAVEYANIVLDGLEKLPTAQRSTVTAQNIKGQALFMRSFAFYQLSQLFCKPYVLSSAGSDLGVPIRLSLDVNQKVGRGSVKQVYDQMINDLKIAIPLLPLSAQYKTRPNSSAANALLAKVCLSMADYQNAYTFADAALKENATLLDFNKLNISSTAPFPSFAQNNPEIMWYAYSYGLTATICNAKATSRISTDLYNSYIPGDLRKTTYFISDGAGAFRPKANYSARPYNFCGIANDEIYLIRAECAARNNYVTIALADINALMKYRLSPDAFVAFTSTDPVTLLNKILAERRRELVLTGNTRWEDLRRLNQDSRFSLTIQHEYHGNTYILAPNDKRYVFPLPQDEITINHLPQNPR
ncbi:RagB/SusD family nutrient uptake outer membrane protein [Mucilaginibacter rubeus]|uniref:RagB/SusD family nutrient uptake outer membrane protein n=1 Tax=Mucilaginibacter rubeus TaxID=2027860 RepID=A0AAE6JDN3_9SPHI|nr:MULTISPECIES: RagB/SusD family nutrient uptake outer membrane protein [Mucilaginibacter]QEM03717.1 RagB/SusD family nutrient uptake outer membrane protein [Mucilaginibacter rubeus]QEM16328.1 RagB/SusD family nutrient uptake outer membrane protein [Mucilaginibacter gossypii]QTE40907.1 RagB/SusD family nutrient uptake outer membrane protein [Mucilaginibacter rubeus]QTE47510.1 RagB/SusD family nutrient uptake outer membrane protein [Mucilaginibacter rubeus]QTE58902.1 RagB/SusD family nutrient 